MVCPKCHIMTQRLRRDNTLEHVCRFPRCKRFGQVVARVEIPAPIVAETQEDVALYDEAEGETTDE